MNIASASQLSERPVRWFPDARSPRGSSPGAFYPSPTKRSAFTLVLPRQYQRVLDVRAKAEAEGLDPDGPQVWERIMEASRG